jgi:mono/diheme cytochrome c family protein
LTEIPEHLLARSKQRRSALSGDADAGEAPVPATTAESAPAAAEESSPAKAEAAVAPAAKAAEVEPTPPWVEAAESRKKIPFWAVPVLVALPFFFIVYAFTLDEPTSTEGPLALGGTGYGVSCSGCHGAGGGGGAGPALAGGAVVETFPRPVDQVTWVALGSTGYQDAGFSTYGATDKPIAGGMPAQDGTLTPAEIMDIVLYERTEFGAETFDIALWEDGFEEAVTELLPDTAEEYTAVIEEWKATPPTA